MFKTLKTILAVSVAFTLVSTSAYSDAISKWATGEFALSTLSETAPTPKTTISEPVRRTSQLPIGNRSA